MLLQACWRVRLVVPYLKTTRTFSALQVKNGSCLDRLWKPDGNKILVRYKLIASRKPRRFRPRYGQDKVSKEFELIYENNMNQMIFWSQLFMYALTVPTVIGSAWTVSRYTEDVPSKLNISHPASTALAYVTFGTSLLFFVNIVCRRSIRRIYFEPCSKRYIAIVQNWMMIPNRLEFSLKDVSSNKPYLSLAKFGNLAIKDRVFFVVGTDFKIPQHYNYFMGWEADRPIEVVKELDVFDFVKKKDQKKS